MGYVGIVVCDGPCASRYSIHAGVPIPVGGFINSRETVMNKVLTRLFAAPIAAIMGLLSIVFTVPALASPDCEGLKGCERKFCEMANQLGIAKAEGNARKADGLARALAEARLHCTDDGLREDLIEEIDEAREDLEAYEADLKESEEEGDIEDVRKYQRKIEEKKNEINDLENELSELV